MPESAGLERRREVERLLDRLSAAVDAVSEQFDSAGQRTAGGESEAGLEARVTELEAENERLRATLVRAKRKAERLRTRLALVEDEV